MSLSDFGEFPFCFWGILFPISGIFILRYRINDGTLYDGTPEEVQERLLDIAIQSARGLYYAHENNLIHRDVKPNNMLLNKEWTVKVSDFGMSKARTMLTFLDGTATELEMNENASVVSQSGGQTPAYCSPEQAAAQLLTKRTDIYSWAVSMLEMYLGYKPWAHGRELTGPLVGIECWEYFEKCSETRPMPKELQLLLAECLEQNPDDRPKDFSVVEFELKMIYYLTTGNLFLSNKPETASDTAENLNNRALSFLDLGMEDDAEKLFKQAIKKDGSRFLYHFNYALYLWNQCRISDRTFMNYLVWNSDASDLYRKKMEILLTMRGGLLEESRKPIRFAYDHILERYWLDWDKEGILYTYYYPRPEDLEPLFQPSATSVDGKYRVTGYEKKDDQRTTRYGYRIENLDTGEIREYPIKYGDYRESMESIADNPNAHHFNRYLNVFFVGPESEFVVVQRRVLWVFESKTGRLVRSMPPVPSKRSNWMSQYYIVGYTQSGVIEFGLSEHEGVKARRMRVDETMSYEIAEFSTTDTRLYVEKELESNYETALRCWNYNDVTGTYRALKRSFEGQVLTMHEPSLKLWSELRKHYEIDSLVTVVPTQDASSPLPIRSERKENQLYPVGFPNTVVWENGETAFSISDSSKYEYDISKHCYEYKYYYSVYATDIRSRNRYYKIKYIEADSKADYDILWAIENLHLKDNIHVEDDYLLWYRTLRGWRMINLAEMSRKSDGRVRFTLPGGYTLKNTKEGVDIGGFVFDDIFTDFRPLWDSDVIACRNNNYRLVYRYKKKREYESFSVKME